MVEMGDSGLAWVYCSRTLGTWEFASLVVGVWATVTLILGDGSGSDLL